MGWYLGIFLVLFLVSCTTAPPSQVYCASDADCVPAECCHATSAVNKENAPDCSAVFCTMDCQPGTLDCGQGEVKCMDGKCTAVLAK